MLNQMGTMPYLDSHISFISNPNQVKFEFILKAQIRAKIIKEKDNSKSSWAFQIWAYQNFVVFEELLIQTQP